MAEPNGTDLQAVGARIRAARKAKDLSQEQLARKVGVLGQSIYRYEKGKMGISGETIAHLAKALDVTVQWLYFGDEPADSRVEPVDEPDSPGWKAFEQLGLVDRYLELGLSREQIEYVRGAKFRDGPPTDPGAYVTLAETLLRRGGS